MRKIIKLLLLLTLTSCSYNTDFYIFNTTDKSTLTNPNEALILKENFVELKAEQNGDKLFRIDDRYIIDFFETIDMHIVRIKVKKAGL